ncbi:MAG: AtpZ/AtpI family protein [Leptospiraceae bacterium]|nr:AtpZ/AtpI family protein [Leptospiraceae bacterium]
MVPDRKHTKVKKSSNLWNLSSLGIEFAFVIVGFVLLGRYIDKFFSSSPWGLLVCCIIGLVSGIYHLMVRTKNFSD